MNAKIKSTLLLSSLLLACAGAHAQKTGDTFVGVGVAYMSPDISLGTLNSVGPAGAAFNAQTAGATASADGVFTLSLSFLYMFTDNIGTELSLGIPPKVTMDVNLTTSSHPAAATAQVLTPALVAKYLFNTPADKWRPYLGLGATYASFREVQANTSDPLVNALGGSSASLSGSWAPVYNVGLIYNIDEKLSINGSISYIPVKTTATFQGTGLGTGTTTSGSLKMNTTDVVVRLAYKF